MNELLNFISETFKLSWLDYELLSKEFTYANPTYLYGLFLIPLLLILLLIKKLYLNSKVTISTIGKSFNLNWVNLLMFLPPIIFCFSLSFFILASARPQKTDDNTDYFTEGIDIVLAMDISGSMEQFLDFKPNRLEAAKKVSAAFIEGRKVDNKASDNIGLVVFAGEAYSKTPLTTDYELLKKHLNTISSKDIQNQGTAIGNALSIALSRIRNSEGKSKIIILLSDGESNSGNIEPISAAQMAYAFGVKIYTIGIGKSGKVPYLAKGRNIWGEEVSQVQYEENTFNESQMKEIAKIGNGKYFRAKTSNNLEGIFDEINKLEKTKIKSRSYQSFSDFFYIYIYWGILFLFLWILLKASFITNAIYD